MLAVLEPGTLTLQASQEWKRNNWTLLKATPAPDFAEYDVFYILTISYNSCCICSAVRLMSCRSSSREAIASAPYIYDFA